jgi:hypothetical protein
MLMGMAKHSLKSNLHLLFSNPLTLQVIGTGGWGEKSLETANLP